MKRKNILLWILTAIFLVLSMLFIAKPAGVLFVLAAVITAPVVPLQDAITQLIEKYGKGFLVAMILVGAVVLLIPKESADGSGDVLADTETTDTTVSQTVQSTQVTEAAQPDTEATETEIPETHMPTQAPTEPPPTDAPTEAPTEIPADTPTEEPTGNDSATIVFIEWPEVIQRGTEGTVTVKGEPNTRYSIQVYYKSGPSTAAGLEDQVSDANGYVTWTWKVSSRTGTGTFKIVVTGGGETQKVEYTVIEAE